MDHFPQQYDQCDFANDTEPAPNVSSLFHFPPILNVCAIRQPNVTVFNQTTFENVLVAFVTAVFTPPQNVSVTLEEFNLTTWTSVLSASTFTNSSGVNTTILGDIETRTGFTAFVPNDAALSGFDIGSLEGNATNLLTVVQNHVSGHLLPRMPYEKSAVC